MNTNWQVVTDNSASTEATLAPTEEKRGIKHAFNITLINDPDIKDIV